MLGCASVLPPPPRYPIQNTGVNGGISPILETSNLLLHPSGPEYQLLVGEGTYVLRDDLHLATPPPHPSEAPVQNPNPLATNPTPPVARTKLSLTIINNQSSSAQLYKVNTTSSTRSGLGPTYSIKENGDETQSSVNGSGDGDASQLISGISGSSQGIAPAFGESNALLVAVVGKDALKRRKPKNNIIKSNSSFVSRVIPHDQLTKRLQERKSDGMFAFANINRAFQWLDLSSLQKSEHLTKILFTKAHALCHDVNSLTKSLAHLDVIMGFSSADIIWYEPMSQKYARINKNGVINATPISEIRWIPGSENLFLAAHMDGSLVVYDKEREDAPFMPEEHVTPIDHTSEETTTSALRVIKSVNSKNQKFNPVASWKLSNHLINGFALSPDSRHLAVVSEDGALRIIDYLKEHYYGGLLCACWSPDGKYVLTGGQDDLVSIWSLSERQIVARCQGHHSWVTAVAFDPWRCDDRNYRFGSVGEDCRLLLWDFAVGMLHRPKASSVRQRGSVSSHVPIGKSRSHRAESQSTLRLRSNSNLTSTTTDDEDIVDHPVEPRAYIAMLPPVLIRIHFAGLDSKKIALSLPAPKVTYARGIGQEKGLMIVKSRYPYQQAIHKAKLVMFGID
ncbi:MAG: hypothetical protein M1827_007687 [Pycnora praestabilis]|nr:MAG: hypothetical protein M1827_007687 [Pycnora praestabilis]